MTVTLKFANNVQTGLSAGVAPGDTVISVNSVTGFPAYSTTNPGYLTIFDNNGNFEVVKATLIVGSQITVTRGQDGTVPQTWGNPASTNVAIRIPNVVLNSFAQVPGSAVDGDIVTFDGTGGNVIKDSGIVSANVVTNAGTGASGNVPSFSANKVIQDSGIVAGNVVTNSGTGANGDLASFSSNKVIQDSGIVASNVVTNTGTGSSGNVATFVSNKVIQDSGIVSGNVVTNSGSGAAGDLASFSSNKVIQDSGIVAANVVTNSGAGTSGDLASFSSNKVIQDSGIVASNVVTNGGTGASGNLSSFVSNKVIQDSGVVASNVVTNSGTGTSGHIASFSSNKVVQDSGVVAANVVTNTTSVTSGHVAVFADGTGKVIKDGGQLVATSVGGVGLFSSSVTNTVATLSDGSVWLKTGNVIPSSQATALVTQQTALGFSDQALMPYKFGGSTVLYATPDSEYIPLGAACYLSFVYAGTTYLVATSTTQYMTSTDYVNWTPRNFPDSIAQDGNTSRISVYALNGNFILVSSDNKRLWYGTDGINWTKIILPTTEQTNYQFNSCMTYGKGYYASISANGQNVVVSPDLISWMTISTGLSAGSNARVVYNSSMSAFVVVANEGSGTTSVYSTSAVSTGSMTWTACSGWSTSNSPANLVSGTNSIMCTTTTSGTNIYKMNSLGTWATISGVSNSGVYSGLCYAASTYVVSQLGTTSSTGYVTDAGTAFNTISTTTNMYYQWPMAANGQFIISNYTGQHWAVMTGTNGTSWTETSLYGPTCPTTSFTAIPIKYLNSKFCFVSGAPFNSTISGTGVTFHTTTDGKTFTVSNIPFASPGATNQQYKVSDFTYHSSAGLYIVVYNRTSGNTPYYATSPDASTWTLRSSMPMSNVGCVFSDGTNVMSLPSGNTTTGGYSSDGVTWTSITVPSPGSSGTWTKIINNSGTLTAYSNSSSTTNVPQSTNHGQSWANVTPTSNINNIPNMHLTRILNGEFVNPKSGNGGYAVASDGLNFTDVTSSNNSQQFPTNDTCIDSQYLYGIYMFFGNSKTYWSSNLTNTAQWNSVAFQPSKQVGTNSAVVTSGVVGCENNGTWILAVNAWGLFRMESSGSDTYVGDPTSATVGTNIGVYNRIA